MTVMWWKDTRERVLTSMAEVLGPMVLMSIVAVQAGKASFRNLPYELALTITSLTGLATLLKCVVARSKGDPNSASLSKHVVISPEVASRVNQEYQGR